MTHPIQIILLRQLAGYLSVPLFLVDPNGDLLFTMNPLRLSWVAALTKRVACPWKYGLQYLSRSTRVDNLLHQSPCL
jgi:hypothetical protein